MNPIRKKVAPLSQVRATLLIEPFSHLLLISFTLFIWYLENHCRMSTVARCKKTLIRPAIINLPDPTIQMQSMDHESYVSY